MDASTHPPSPLNPKRSCNPPRPLPAPANLAPIRHQGLHSPTHPPPLNPRRSCSIKPIPLPTLRQSCTNEAWTPPLTRPAPSTPRSCSNLPRPLPPPANLAAMRHQCLHSPAQPPPDSPRRFYSNRPRLCHHHHPPPTPPILHQLGIKASTHPPSPQPQILQQKARTPPRYCQSCTNQSSTPYSQVLQAQTPSPFHTQPGLHHSSLKTYTHPRLQPLLSPGLTPTGPQNLPYTPLAAASRSGIDPPHTHTPTHPPFAPISTPCSDLSLPSLIRHRMPRCPSQHATSPTTTPQSHPANHSQA
ncbi:leucine-rich repeat extensin-like protein 3 [Leopardus geoffroyi]|uniref:leucine-rich repeat extensin-like protein 3 n=1 Tax=Leopardus geoffroyi TaxID=46844 RepID=UPI001E25FFC2|nr:leucine-rich repeat extensin-like protein 3 [Leopardus geoffroyi]